jgi:LysM repeat protein
VRRGIFAGGPHWVAKAGRFRILPPMKSPLRPLGVLALAAFLPSCSVDGTGSSSFVSSHPTNTGPFDSRGNYIEDWADSPEHWNRPSRPATMLASVDEPPRIAAHEQPPMDAVPIASNAPAPRPVARTSNTGSSTVVVAAKPRPQAAAKPTPKPAAKPAPKKPATVRYTIRKGDTLSAIAKRHGSTVGAIQRTNGIKGTLIHPGKVLVIPKS